MEHDPALEERIWAVVTRLRARMPWEEEAMRAGARKQAMVPVGATVLEPVGTAPGLLVGVVAAGGGAAGPAARAADDVGRRGHGCAACGAAGAGGDAGAADPALLPAARAADRGDAARDRRGPVRGHDLPAARGARGRDGLRAVGEAAAYAEFEAALRERHGDVLFSDDGATIDEVVARAAGGPDDRDGRVLHRRPDGGPADRPGRAPRRTCWAGSSSTPTRPRPRWPACRRS